MKQLSFKKRVSVLLAIATLLCVFTCTSCTLTSEKTDTAETTKPKTETTDIGTIVTTNPTESETSEPEEDKSLRVLITSDIHYTDNTTWYGIGNKTRTQMWVNAVLAEHEQNPFDLIVINGDISLDYCQKDNTHQADVGSYTTRSNNTSVEFVKNYVSQLPQDVPIFILPGNHEKYNNEQWLLYVGNERQGSIEIKGNLFIMVDTYYGNVEPNYDNDTATYSTVDVDFVKQEMAKYPDDQVWLIGHYFSEALETTEFKELLRTNGRIKGLFAGHTHRNDVVGLSADCGHKKIAETGEFSYSYYSTKTPISEYMTDIANSFWGFRDLTITEEHAVSNYIIAKTSGAVVNGKTLNMERREIKSVTFY